MPELVHGDEPHQRQQRGAERADGREKRLVFHSAGFERVPGRDYDGDLPVGIGAERARKIVQPVARRLQGDARSFGVLGRVQDLEADAVPVRLQRRRVPVPCREGEVVHVVLRDPVDDAGGALRRRRGLDTHRPQGVPARHRDGRAIAAEVRVELAVEVELVAVPVRLGRAALAGQLEHADLRKPLGDEMVRAEPTRPRHHARKLIVKFDLENRRSTRGYRAGQIEARDGAIGQWTAIGMHERPRHRLPVLRHAAELDVAPLAAFRPGLAAESTVPLPFARESGLLSLERVQVQMDVQLADGLGAPVAPGEALVPVETVPDRVERRLQIVVRDALRSLALPHATPCRRAARDAHRTGRGTGKIGGEKQRCEHTRVVLDARPCWQ